VPAIKEPALAILSEGAFHDHYDLNKSIGKGTFGLVKLCTDRETGEVVVVKFLDKSKVCPSK
jgi:serine/threonine protein kinase